MGIAMQREAGSNSLESGAKPTTEVPRDSINARYWSYLRRKNGSVMPGKFPARPSVQSPPAAQNPLAAPTRRHTTWPSRRAAPIPEESAPAHREISAANGRSLPSDEDFRRVNAKRLTKEASGRELHVSATTYFKNCRRLGLETIYLKSYRRLGLKSNYRAYISESERLRRQRIVDGADPKVTAFLKEKLHVEPERLAAATCTETALRALMGAKAEDLEENLRRKLQARFTIDRLVRSPWLIV